MKSFLAIILILIGFIYPCEKYDRSLYRHWVDQDKNGLDTRHEVLKEESLDSPTVAGNKVISGRWKDPYTGLEYTDPKKLDIDHLVPLSEAHRSGAWAWDKDRRLGYANYLIQKNHLVAVGLAVNRSKGDRDPARWLPPDTSYHVQYVKDWADVKARWGLTADSAEVGAIVRVLGEEKAKIWLRGVRVAEEFVCEDS